MSDQKKRFALTLKMIIILFILVIIVVRFPKRKILVSPISNGKYITVFRPFQLLWQNEYYIIPKKYTGLFKPSYNYFILTPMTDQDMSIDWSPSNYELTIQLPFCEDVQKVIYKIDTTKYHIAEYCGNNFKYIIPSEPRYYDRKRYSLYFLKEWLP